MSLAYFIGKNLDEADDGTFTKLFPLVLFWAALTTSFPDLARQVKLSPRFLPDVLDLVRYTHDIVELRHTLDSIDKRGDLSERKEGPKAARRTEYPEQRPKDQEWQSDRLQAWDLLNRKPWLVKFSNEHLVDDRLMFRFLKAFTLFEYENRSLSLLTLDEIRYIYEKAGLMS